MPRSPINNTTTNNNDDLKKGPWSQEEDQKLIDYVEKHGHGSWQMLPKKAGLNRCGKSCRLRWTNYLRPDIKRGNFSPEEEQTIIHLHSMLGNKWATIATRLPGRTDNEIKNYWNTQLRKKLLNSGIDPKTHQPIINQENHLNLLLNLPSLFPNSNMNNPIMKNQIESLTKLRLLSNILQVLNPNPVPTFLEGSLPNFGQLEGLNNGISSDHPMQQISSMAVPNMELFNNTLPTNFQPILNNFETSTPEEFRHGENDGRIGSTSNTNTTTNSEYSLPALVPATLEMSNQGDGVYGTETLNYDELLPICNDSMRSWGMDDEASSSFWKDIFTESSSL